MNLFSFRKLGDGLFLECCKKVSESYPNIEFDSMIVDNCSMQVRLKGKCTIRMI